MNPELFMKALQSGDPQIMDQIATTLAQQQIPAPAPGAFQDAKGQMLNIGGTGMGFAPNTAPIPGQAGLGDILQGSQGPMPNPGAVPASQVGGPALGSLLANGNPMGQGQDMAGLGLAAQALKSMAPQEKAPQPGNYFNPPIAGSANIAKPLAIPQGMTPRASLPSLGMLLSAGGR